MLACSFGVALGVISLFGSAMAQFPARGDDIAKSLGLFEIHINTPYQPIVYTYPGYEPATARLTSPMLYDPNTLIGRSDPHTHGSPPDVNGTLVGIVDPQTISDANFTDVPPGFQGPPGTREVHTKVTALNMVDFGATGAAVRAGLNAPGQPISPGEVESNCGPCPPANDFPAQSFFDVFVEVDLPAAGSFPGATLYNQQPLRVANDNLTSFPPGVVYIHGNSTAVPVHFRSAHPGLWNANDLFGWLTLAGHGVDRDTVVTHADTVQFRQAMQNAPHMPCPACPPPTGDPTGVENLPRKDASWGDVKGLYR